MKLFEIYAKDHRELYNYLKSSNDQITKIKRLFDYDDDGNIIEWLNDEIGIGRYNETYNTDYSDFFDVPFNKLIDFLKDKLSKFELNDLIDDAENKLSSHMDNVGQTEKFMDVKNIIPRNTWLIHFSDNADEIVKKGFIYGMDDIANLGLTTYFKNGVGSKSSYGWNFAFIANSGDVLRSFKRGKNKYGTDAVMFQSSGVEVYHMGDEENQVVFQGKYIKPKDIILLIHNNDSEWNVMSRNNKILYKNENIKKVIEWVENNYHQYRKNFV